MRQKGSEFDRMSRCRVAQPVATVPASADRHRTRQVKGDLGSLLTWGGTPGALRARDFGEGQAGGEGSAGATLRASRFR